MTIESMLDHLKSRHMDVSLYPGVVVDIDNATFPLWNLSGQMIGYQAYRPDKEKLRSGAAHPRDMKYYTYVSRYGGVEVANAVWGLETLDYEKPLFLCEGIFDACRLHLAGLPALALLGADQKHLRPWLSCLTVKRIAAVQGDATGRKLAKYGHKAIFLPDGKDVGDLTEEEFRSLFDNYL